MATLDDGWGDAIDAALAELVDHNGMDIAFGARVSANGGQIVIERIRGGLTTAMQDLVVHGGTGLGGKAMVLNRPVTVNDYLRARGISHQYDGIVSQEGIHSIMAVPIVVSGHITGVLYAALRQRLGIGDRMQKLALKVAQQTQLRLTAHSAEPARWRGCSDTATMTAPATRHGVDNVCIELRSIIDRVDDWEIRARLEAVHAQLTTPRTRPPTVVALSAREHEALGFAALGLSNAEIGQQMGLVPATVKAYLRSVMRKLDCHNRIAAVNAARALGYHL